MAGERLYQALNGRETAAWLRTMIEELTVLMETHQHLREHVTWPRASASLRLTLSSPDSQPRVELELSGGPILAPDEVRAELGLGTPHVVVDKVGKREVAGPARGKTTKER